jgi:hypothetical protein
VEQEIEEEEAVQGCAQAAGSIPDTDTNPLGGGRYLTRLERENALSKE